MIRTPKTLREAHQMTQQEMAKYVGVTQAAISQYETGVRTPTLREFHKIAVKFSNALGCYRLLRIYLGLEEETK